MLKMEDSGQTKAYSEANFGEDYPRQCICEIPGQVPCPGWQPLPDELRGKWCRKMAREAREKEAES